MTGTILFGALFVAGQFGLYLHKYEHLDGAQSEITCQLCIAGDHNQPLPAVSNHSPPLERALSLPVAMISAPALRPLPSAHPPRAPPHHA